MAAAGPGGASAGLGAGGVCEGGARCGDDLTRPRTRIVGPPGKARSSSRRAGSSGGRGRGQA